MSSYGKVISGGARLTKGLDKSINDKLSGHAAEGSRRAVVAGAVSRAFTQNPLSDNHTQNVDGGKFTTPKLPKRI